MRHLRFSGPSAWMISLALLAVALGLSLLALDSLANVEINQPMKINDTVRWAHEDVTVRSEVRVLEGGSLEVFDTTVVFDGGYLFEAGITVEPGGALKVSSDGSRCVFQRGESNVSYFLRAYPDSTLELSNLSIRGASTNTSLLDPWQWGVCFTTDNVLVVNCEVTDAYLGLGFEGASGVVIKDSTFIDCQNAIMARQCGDIQIVNCTFRGCRRGIEYALLNAAHSAGLLIRGCDFEQCRYGINLGGGIHSVIDCRFSDGYRCIYGSGAGWLTFDNLSVNGSETGIYLYGVKVASLQHIIISGCDIGLVAEGSTGVSLDECKITDCRLAVQGYCFWGENGTSITISDTEIAGCDYGIGSLVLQPVLNPMAHLTLERVRIVDTVTAFSINGCMQNTIRGCEVEGATITMKFSNCTLLGMRDNDLKGGCMVLSLEGVGSAEIVDDTFSVDSLEIGVTSSNISLFDPFFVPSLPEVVMANDSTAVSVLPPGAVNLECRDTASRWIWVKRLVVQVYLSSTDAVAIGCDLTVSDPDDLQNVSSIVGFLAEVDLGWIWISIYNSSRIVPLEPHILRLRYSSLSQTFNVTLSEESGKVVREVLWLDDVPPLVRITSPEDGAILPDGTVHSKGSTKDASNTPIHVVLEWDGSPSESVVDYWDLVHEVTPGWHRLVARAVDEAGNHALAEVWFRILDTSVILTVDSPMNGTLTNLGTVEVKGRLAGGGWLTVDTVWTPVAADGSFSDNVSLQEGLNHIILEYGTDVVMGQVSFLVEKDSVPPVLFIDPLPKAVNSTSVSISGEADDLHGPLSVNINGIDIVVKSKEVFSLPIILETGVQTVKISAFDAAGNGASVELRTMVDLTFDLALASELPAQTDEPFLLLQLKTEAGSNLTVYLNGGMVATGRVEGMAYNVPLELPEAGNYSIRVVGVDEAGNRGELSGSIVRVNPHTVGGNDHTFPLLILSVVGLLVVITVFLLSKLGRTGNGRGMTK